MFQLVGEYVCNVKLAELFAKVVVAPNSAEVANGKKFTLAMILNRSQFSDEKEIVSLSLRMKWGSIFNSCNNEK